MKPLPEERIQRLEGFDRQVLEESLDVLARKVKETRAQRRQHWKEMVIQTAGATATKDRGRDPARSRTAGWPNQPSLQGSPP